MDPRDVMGMLADGGRYRVTAYMVEVADPAGAVRETVDRNDVKEVQRKGQTVTIKRRKGKDLVLQAATLDDAGRLESVLRGVPAAAVQPVKGSGGFIRKAGIGCGGLIGLVVLIVIIVSVASNGSKKDEQAAATTSAPNSATGQTSGVGGSTPATPSAQDEAGTPTTQTAQPVAASAAAPSAAALRDAAPLVPGSRIKVGSLIITLNGVTDPYVSSNQFERPSAGQRFVAIDVTLTNDSDRPYDYNTLFDWKAQDADAFTYSPSLIAAQPFLGAGKLTVKGDQARGFVTFSAKESAAIKGFIFKSLISTNQGKFESR